MKNLLLAAVCAAAFAGPALADEDLQPLEQSGNWTAVAHRKSMVDPPDVCLMVDLGGVFFLRASQEDFEVRTANENWSLPAGVKGDISVTVGSYSAAFQIDFNTADTVIATVTPAQAVALLDAMDNGASIVVTAGHDKPKSVSLSGSTRVATAFRTCAGIKGGQSDPGANPFDAPAPATSE